MLQGHARKQAGRHWRRTAALAGTVALGAAALTAVATGPALAAPKGADQIYLVNAPLLGMYAVDGVQQNSQIAVNPDYGGYWKIVTVPAPSDQVELQAVTSHGAPTNWCIASTAEYQAPTLQACGANGTVFIVSLNGNGFFLESRFFANEGKDDVLAVTYPAPGTQVTTRPASQVGGAIYGRWVDTQNLL